MPIDVVESFRDFKKTLARDDTAAAILVLAEQLSRPEYLSELLGHELSMAL